MIFSGINDVSDGQIPEKFKNMMSGARFDRNIDPVTEILHIFCGYSVIAFVAENEPGSLILLTCESESVEGGYLNRRVVFAKPQ